MAGDVTPAGESHEARPRAAVYSDAAARRLESSVRSATCFARGERISNFYLPPGAATASGGRTTAGCVLWRRNCSGQRQRVSHAASDDAGRGKGVLAAASASAPSAAARCYNRTGALICAKRGRARAPLRALVRQRHAAAIKDVGDPGEGIRNAQRHTLAGWLLAGGESEQQRRAVLCCAVRRPRRQQPPPPLCHCVNHLVLTRAKQRRRRRRLPAAAISLSRAARESPNLGRRVSPRAATFLGRRRRRVFDRTHKRRSPFSAPTIGVVFLGRLRRRARYGPYLAAAPPPVHAALASCAPADEQPAGGGS